jgi:hypothetical protein
MILPLFIYRNSLTAGFDNKVGDIIVTVGTLASLFFAIYCIRHLSVWDFRAYKVGNSIPDLMKPACAPAYQYIMTKEGKDETFDKYPTDTTYQFKEMILTNPECATPKITDYSVWGEDGDYTQETFKGKKLIIVMLHSKKADVSHLSEIKDLAKSVENTDIKPIIITGTDRETFEEFRHEQNLGIPYYFADGVVIKTIIRSNPGIMYLENGVVKGKWHHNDVPKLEDLK